MTIKENAKEIGKTAITNFMDDWIENLIWVLGGGVVGYVLGIFRVLG